MGRFNFKGRKGQPIVKYSDNAMICAEMAELVEVWVMDLVGPRKHY